MITTGAWQPVIERSSALGARAASLLDSITSEAAANSGLDTALLLSYRAVAERNAPWMKRAVEQLNSAIAGADALYSTRRFELFNGLAGLGWVIEHVTRQLNRFRGSPEGGERAAKLLNEAIDVALLLELQRGRWKGTGDLVSGLAGIGVYFLQGLPDPTSKFGLELVLAHLDDATKSAPPCNGLGGVAAGAAGMLYLAAEATAAGVATLQAGRLVAACEAAVLHHQIESQGPCCWWSDELAIAAVCMQRQLHSAEISHWTKRVLRECLERIPDGEFQDVSLLHGAAGTAHLWSRIYGRTGDTACRATALEWWERAILWLEKATPAAGAAGVQFLEGSAGIGLALSAALTPLEPEWDGLLCLWHRS